ncbi:MAG: amino acid decarboxylase [Deferribacteres bacterium]|nr:amino acid decarboxylase [candidate division KSB1 bacterium]MCB9511662.1 amino acid decarboxylase [Deferribacteres bacterium]
MHENDLKFTGDMSAADFRKYGYAMVDWIANFFDTIEDRPVLPAIQPGDIRSKIPSSAPKLPEAFEKMIADIDRVIMPGMTHWNHPRYLAYFSSVGSAPGVLGELLAAALNINGMLWQSCPSSTELEQVTTAWMRQLLGLPDHFFGVIYDTGSVSTMHALAAAREQMADLQIREKGMTGRADLPRLRLYISEHTHSSIDKAALALGIGMEGIRRIPSDANFAMQPEALRTAIQEDRSTGWRPFCVVATIGTTSTTAVDPVAEIANICEREDLWLHVDAAYAGSAAILPEMQHHFAGWEKADSVLVNPHKWLFVPLDLSLMYTRKPGVLRRAFSLVPEYLRTAHDDNVVNFMDYGIPLGRRFRSIKLWFVLRYYGVDGLMARLRYHIQLAQNLAQKIDADSDFERVAPTHFSTVAFRACPAGWQDEDALNKLNARLLEAVNATRRFYLTHTKIGGKFVLRIAIGNIRTEARHIEDVWQLLRTMLRDVLKNVQNA